MTNTTAKIIVRKGDLQDLPTLDTGELGFANDVNRLFIGSDPVIRTGDGSTTEFNFDISLENLDGQVYKIVITDSDGSNPVPQILDTDFTVDNEVVTFSTAPANLSRIVLYYNAELLTTPTVEGDDANRSQLLANATGLVVSGVNLNKNANDYVNIEYRITTGGTSHRRGVLSIGLEPTGSTATIDDMYQTTDASLDHDFAVVYNNDDFELQYTTTYSSNVDFAWRVRDFKSLV